MQDLFTKLLWESEEISQAVACLCETIPGYQSSKKECAKIISQVQSITGYELCNQLLEQLTECGKYEEYAHYAVGLGLRETLIRELNM